MLKNWVIILSDSAGENASYLIFKFWKKSIDKSIFMFYNQNNLCVARGRIITFLF